MTQDAQETAADRLAKVQRIARLADWAWDVSTGEVRVDEDFFRLHGAVPESGRFGIEVLTKWAHPQDRPNVEAALRNLTVTGAPMTCDYRVLTPADDVRDFHARALAVQEADGKVAKVVGTVQDLTGALTPDRAGHEAERLRREAAFRAEFISKAAHELRTPLLPIRVQTHILATTLGAQPDPRQQKALDSLVRNLDRLNRLVDDLLEASRLQAGRVKLQRVPFELSELVEDALESFRPVAEQLGLRLTGRIRHGAVVDADPHRLLQVLHNLLGNAMKFTPQGGSVRVSVERIEERVLIRVEDTGPGIEAEELDRLFQPFTQTASGKGSSAPGSGLGLYVSRGIVEEHGGRIAAESAGLGKGATFIVDLPFSGQPPQPLQVAAQAPNWWREAAPDERAARFRDLI